MTKNYQRTALDTRALTVPDQVSVAMGEIAAELREGLLALAVGAGLQVMQQLMEADVAAGADPEAAQSAGAAPGAFYRGESGEPT